MTPWLVVVLLGIIEGITEFLPVSSTGHLLLAEQWLPKQSDLFNVVIQSGAVLAVLPLFSDRLKRVFCDLRAPQNLDFVIKVFVAFFITGVGGFLMEKKGFKLPEEHAPVAWALLIGGIIFVLAEYWVKNKPKTDEITWAIVAAVGFGQLIAAGFPGASRSGSTIILCLLLGMNRPAATEFSFLVGIPTMLAAGGYKIFKEMHHVSHENWSMLWLSTLVSAIVSFIVVKWLIRFVQSHTFNSFAVYRIAVGVAMLWYFWQQPPV